MTIRGSDENGNPIWTIQGMVATSPMMPNQLMVDCGTFAAATTGAIGTHPLFNVTGIVAVSIFGVCGTDITSGGACTLEVGVASSTAGLLPLIVFSTWDANEVWEMTDTNLNKLILDSLLLKKIVTESAINLKITDATATGGSAKFYLSWYPLSPGATVTAVTPFA